MPNLKRCRAGQRESIVAEWGMVPWVAAGMEDRVVAIIRVGRRPESSTNIQCGRGLERRGVDMSTRNRLRFVRALAGSVAVLVAATGLASADEIALERGASEVADTLLEELGEAMTREMNKGGPTEAIVVCTRLASEVAGRLSREHGWRGTRVGRRGRNALLR